MDIQVYQKVDGVETKVDRSMNLSRVQEAFLSTSDFKLNASNWYTYSYKKWVISFYSMGGSGSLIYVYDRTGTLITQFSLTSTQTISNLIELADNKLLVHASITSTFYWYILDLNTMTLSSSAYSFNITNTYSSIYSIAYVDNKIYILTYYNSNGGLNLYSLDCNLQTNSLSNFNATPLASNLSGTGKYFNQTINKLPNNNYLIFMNYTAYEVSSLVDFINSGTYVATYTGLYNINFRSTIIGSFMWYKYIISGNMFIGTDVTGGLFVIDFVNKTIKHYYKDNSYATTPRFNSKIVYKGKTMFVDFKTNATQTVGTQYIFNFGIITTDASGNVKAFKTDTRNIGYTSVGSATSYWYFVTIENDVAYLICASGSSNTNAGITTIEAVNVTDMLEEVYKLCS